jgi:hypothetical protein
MRINIVGGNSWGVILPLNEIVWGFNTQIIARSFNVLFDMHDVKAKLGQTGTDLWAMSGHSYKELVAAMNLCEKYDITVFTLGQVGDTSYIPYPIDEIKREFGSDYFTAGLSYALALAIYQGADEICIWGCTGEKEYEYQRPSAEFWMGVAIGRGISVTIETESEFLKTHDHLMYGYNTKQGE